MDEQAFDRFARALARTDARQPLLRYLSVLLLGPLLIRLGRISTASDFFSSTPAWAATVSQQDQGDGVRQTATDIDTCAMPKDSQGCAKLGYGIAPFYVEGWVCPTSECQSGYCSAAGLERPGRCGATAAQIREIALDPQGKLLQGTLPSTPGGSSTPSAFVQGQVVSLRGTPHLWVADEQGALHWAGDTRALIGREVKWTDRTEVTLGTFQTLPRGEPWFSAGLLKDGEPIYLVKWEVAEPKPVLLHIRSIKDVELFGITAANYGTFVLERAAWERRYGLPVAGLQRAQLASTGT